VVDKGNAYEGGQYNRYETLWDQQDRRWMKVMHMKVASLQQYNHYETLRDQQDRWSIKVMHMKVASIIATKRSRINGIDGE
jgi:hypothetical protein